MITLSWNGVKTISGIGDSPTDVTFSPDGARAYVTNLDGTVAVVNTATQTITSRITTPTPAKNAAVTPDGTVLLVAGTNGALTAIDTSTNTILKNLQADPHTVIYLAVANNQLLVALTAPRANSAPTPAPGVEVGAPEPVAGIVTGTVRYDDADGDTLTYTLQAAPSYGTATVNSATGVFKYTPKPLAAATTDTFTVTVSDGYGGTVLATVTVPVVSGTAPVTIATVRVGTLPDGVTVSPDGSHAYVANGNGNSVSVIDTATNTVAATIPVGAAPWGVAFSPDGSHAYVTNTAG